MRSSALIAGIALFVAAVATARAPAPRAHVGAMRGPVPLDTEPAPPPLAAQENKDVRRMRAFAMQPPTDAGPLAPGEERRMRLRGTPALPREVHLVEAVAVAALDCHKGIAHRLPDLASVKP